MIQYPPVFLERMRSQLGEQSQRFFDSLQELPVRGIRFNPKKPVDISKLNQILEKIPWYCKGGYYLSQTSKLGAHPLHECGAYYIQEPSAMAPVSVLSPKPDEYILDLCAAPGGKSTQIAELMQGKGLLVCNEPVPSRAKILSRNIERMGISNSLVVSENPSVLAKKWPEHFNAVLVDAPCSGEGMFRRHPETIQEWNETSAAFCAERQAEILESAAKLVAPGGRMVYSTCTYNTTEDENTIDRFLASHSDWHVTSFDLPVNHGIAAAPEGKLHLYPHTIKGEGHFIALLHKDGSSDPSTVFQMPSATAELKKNRNFQPAFDRFTEQFGVIPFPNLFFGETAVLSPSLPQLNGIHVLRIGIHLGELKEKLFIPNHAVALALPVDSDVEKLEISTEEAVLFQYGEILSCSENRKGYLLPCLEGIPLGFGKASNGQIKNHYPKGLRKPAERDFSDD